ncbi:MAG: hypothetical protein R2911_09520 [Caldilineaceae bacterium]
MRPPPSGTARPTPPPSITLGITEHICGVDNVPEPVQPGAHDRQPGRGGGGINPMRGQNNIQGADVRALSPAITRNSPWTSPQIRPNLRRSMAAPSI